MHIQKVKDLIRRRESIGEKVTINYYPSIGVSFSSGTNSEENCLKIGCLIKKEVLNILNEYNCVETKEWEINELRQDLGDSQNIELRYKEKKLDELIRNSGLNRVRVINLRDAYKKLIKAREEYNQENIANADTEIETIKQEFFQTNVNINGLHEIYKLCEKITELQIKLESQYESLTRGSASSLEVNNSFSKKDDSKHEINCWPW